MSMEAYQQRLAEKAARKLRRRAQLVRFLLLAKKYLGWVPNFVAKKIKDWRTSQQQGLATTTPSTNQPTQKKASRFTKTKVAVGTGTILGVIIILYKWGGWMVKALKPSRPSAIMPSEVPATTAWSIIVVGLLVIGILGYMVYKKVQGQKPKGGPAENPPVEPTRKSLWSDLKPANISFGPVLKVFFWFFVGVMAVIFFALVPWIADQVGKIYNSASPSIMAADNKGNPTMLLVTHEWTTATKVRPGMKVLWAHRDNVAYEIRLPIDNGGSTKTYSHPRHPVPDLRKACEADLWVEESMPSFQIRLAPNETVKETIFDLTWSEYGSGAPCKEPVKEVKDAEVIKGILKSHEPPMMIPTPLVPTLNTEPKI